MDLGFAPIVERHDRASCGEGFRRPECFAVLDLLDAVCDLVEARIFLVVIVGPRRWGYEPMKIYLFVPGLFAICSP